MIEETCEFCAHCKSAICYHPAEPKGKVSLDYSCDNWIEEDDAGFNPIFIPVVWG